MKCDNCGERLAEIHISETIGGKEVHYHLCEHCAQKKGINIEADMTDFSVQNLVGGLLKVGIENKNNVFQEDVMCDGCGLTFNEFKNIGRFGCAKCYSAFEDGIEPILRKIHGNSCHRGKHPKNYPAYDVKEEMTKLREALNNAVKNEEYEKAAVLRDKLKFLSEVSS